MDKFKKLNGYTGVQRLSWTNITIQEYKSEKISIAPLANNIPLDQSMKRLRSESQTKNEGTRIFPRLHNSQKQMAVYFRKQNVIISTPHYSYDCVEPVPKFTERGVNNQGTDDEAGKQSLASHSSR